MDLRKKGFLKSFLNSILPNNLIKNKLEIEKLKTFNFKKEIKKEYIDLIKKEIEKSNQIIRNLILFQFNNELSLKENIIIKINKMIFEKEDVLILMTWLNRLGIGKEIKNIKDLLLNEDDLIDKNLYKIPKRKSNYFSKNIKNKIIVIEGLDDEEDEEEIIKEKKVNIINIKDDKTNEENISQQKNENLYLNKKVPNFKIDLPMEKIDEVVSKKKKKKSNFSKNEKEKNQGKTIKNKKHFSERKITKNKLNNKLSIKKKNQDKIIYTKDRKSKVSKRLSKTIKENSFKKEKKIKSEKNSLNKNNQINLEIDNSDLSCKKHKISNKSSQNFKKKNKKISIEIDPANLSEIPRKNEFTKLKKKEKIILDVDNKKKEDTNKIKNKEKIKNKNKVEDSKKTKNNNTLELSLKPQDKDYLFKTPLNKEKKKLKKLTSNNIKFLNISSIKDPRKQRKSFLINLNDKSDLDFQDILKELDKKNTDKKILNDINLNSFLESNKKNNSFNLDENSHFEINKYNSDQDINNYFEKNLKKNNQKAQKGIFYKKITPDKIGENKLLGIVKNPINNLDEINGNKNDVDSIKKKRTIKNYVVKAKNKESKKKNINEELKKIKLDYEKKPIIIKKIKEKDLKQNLNENLSNKDIKYNEKDILANEAYIKKKLEKDIQNFCIFKSKKIKNNPINKKKNANFESVNIFQRKIKENLKKDKKYKEIVLFTGIYLKNSKTLKISKEVLEITENKRGIIKYSFLINKKQKMVKFEKNKIIYKRSKTCVQKNSNKNIISSKEEKEKICIFQPKIIVLNHNLPVKRKKDDRNYRKKLKKRKINRNKNEIKSMDIFVKNLEVGNLKKTINHNKREKSKSIKYLHRNFDHDETIVKGDLIKSEVYSINNNLSKKKDSGISLSRSWNITNPENFINHSKKSFDNLSNDLVINFKNKNKNNFSNNKVKSCFLMKPVKLLKSFDKKNISILINMFKKIMIFNAKIEDYQKKVLFDQNFSLLELFRLYDKNDNGIINFEDLKIFCYDMDLKLSDKLITVIIIYLNQKDQNNFLNFKAFSKLLYPSLKDQSNLFSEFFKIKNEFYKISKINKNLIKNVIVLRLKMIEHISKSIKKITNFSLKDFFVFLTDSIKGKIDWKILKSFLEENNIFFTEDHILYIFKEISGNNFCLINLEDFDYFWNFFNNFNKK